MAENVIEEYERSHLQTLELVNQVQEKLMNMPAPDTGVKINWGHVGSLGHVKELLRQVLDSIPN